MSSFSQSRTSLAHRALSCLGSLTSRMEGTPCPRRCGRGGWSGPPLASGAPFSPYSRETEKERRKEMVGGEPGSRIHISYICSYLSTTELYILDVHSNIMFKYLFDFFYIIMVDNGNKNYFIIFFFIKPDSRQKIHIGTRNVNYKFKLRRVYKYIKYIR